MIWLRWPFKVTRGKPTITLYLFTSTNPKHTLPSDIILRRTTFTQPILPPSSPRNAPWLSSETLALYKSLTNLLHVARSSGDWPSVELAVVCETATDLLWNNSRASIIDADIRHRDPAPCFPVTSTSQRPTTATWQQHFSVFWEKRLLFSYAVPRKRKTDLDTNFKKMHLTLWRPLLASCARPN